MLDPLSPVSERTGSAETPRGAPEAVGITSIVGSNSPGDTDEPAMGHSSARGACQDSIGRSPLNLSIMDTIFERYGFGRWECSPSRPLHFSIMGRCGSPSRGTDGPSRLIFVGPCRAECCSESLCADSCRYEQRCDRPGVTFTRFSAVSINFRRFLTVSMWIERFLSFSLTDGPRAQTTRNPGCYELTHELRAPLKPILFGSVSLPIRPCNGEIWGDPDQFGSGARRALHDIDRRAAVTIVGSGKTWPVYFQKYGLATELRAGR